MHQTQVIIFIFIHILLIVIMDSLFFQKKKHFSNQQYVDNVLALIPNKAHSYRKRTLKECEGNLFAFIVFVS